MPSSVFLVLAVVGFLAFTGLVGYANYAAAKRRSEGMARVAAGRGWSYTARDDSWADRFGGSPFGAGFDRQALNIVRGDHDRRHFIAFDYWFKTREGGGRSRRTVRHPYSIVAISTKAVLPHLTVTPEGWVGRLVGRLTGEDIELESEAFNHAFTVTCPDRRFAVDVLHPQMMELLLTTPHLGWSLHDGVMMVATPGQHDLSQLDARLAGIDRILDEVPELVWKEFGIQDPGASAL